jgi:hypothetical protein
VTHRAALALRAGIVLVVLTASTACSAFDGGGSTAALVPAETNQPTIHGPVSLHVPDGFSPQDRTANDHDATTPVMLVGPKSAAGVGTAISVRSEHAERDLATTAESLLGLVTRTRKATEITNQQLDWPGADDARFVVYETDLPAGKGKVRARYESLLLRAGSRTIIVGSAGEAAAFGSSGLHDALSTVRLADASDS